MSHRLFIILGISGKTAYVAPIYSYTCIVNMCVSRHYWKCMILPVIMVTIKVDLGSKYLCIGVDQD